MGNPAIASLLGLRGISKVRGEVLFSAEFPGVYFVPTIHPAAALRRWEDRVPIVHDFKKAARIAREGSYARRETTYQVCRSVEEVRNLLDRLRATTTDYVSIDTETTSVDPYTTTVMCFSLSNREGTGWLIPLWGYKMRPIWSETDFALIVDLLKRFLESDIPKAGQNLIQFDKLVCRGSLGIEINNIVLDTMYLHHVVDENLPDSLEFLSGWYTDLPAYKNIPEMYKPGGFSNVTEDRGWPYAIADADSTYRVAHVLEAEAEEDHTRIVHDRILLPLGHVLAEAEWHGIRVDMKKLNQFHEEHSTRLRLLETQIYELAGVEFNVGSWQQTGKVLYDMLGLPVVKETESGGRSTDNDALVQIKDQHPIVPLLLQHSIVSHDIKNYLKGLDGESGMLKYIHADGRVHPRWMEHVAVTGRLSSSDPNIQAIKKGSWDGTEPDFRPLFAATEGWFWLHTDFKTMEIRVVAAVAQDDVLMEDLKEDVHRLVASQVFGCAPSEVTKEQREQAKGIDFGLNYGRTEYTLAAELKITVTQAREYIANYWKRYKKVKAHFDRTIRKMHETGEVVTPFGRKRHLYCAADMKRGIQSGRYSEFSRKQFERVLREMERQAINDTVQSPANDVLGLATIRIHARFKQYGMKARMLISHHDAWMGECPEEELEQVCSIVKEELERPVPELGDMSFPVEFKIGRFWSDESVKLKGF